MSTLKWELLTEISGRLDAEMLKSFFEAEGVPVQLFQEGAGQDIYPVNIGPLATVQVFVPINQIDDARILLDAFNAGKENDQELPADSKDVN